MPIQILSQSFTDDFGNTLPSYRANAGDRVTMSTRLISSIRISSLTNPFKIELPFIVLIFVPETKIA